MARCTLRGRAGILRNPRSAPTLTFRPRRWLSRDFVVTGDGEEIAVLDFHWMRERVGFSVDGAAYEARRTSVLRGSFVLDQSGSVVAEAMKPSMLRRAFELRHGAERYRLEPEAFLRRDVRLVRGGIPVGLIWPTSAFRRGGAARLPATVPRPVQLFMVTLVLILWNRDAAAAAS